MADPLPDPKAFPLWWEREVSPGVRESGAYGRDNGDGTVTIWDLEFTDRGTLKPVERTFLRETVKLEPR